MLMQAHPLMQLRMRARLSEYWGHLDTESNGIEDLRTRGVVDGWGEPLCSKNYAPVLRCELKHLFACILRLQLEVDAALQRSQKLSLACMDLSESIANCLL